MQKNQLHEKEEIWILVNYHLHIALPQSHKGPSINDVLKIF